MKEKKLLIISGSIIAILFVIYLIALLTNKKEDPNEAKVLLNDEEYFKIQNIIKTELQKEENEEFIFIANEVYYKNQELDYYYFVKGYYITHEETTFASTFNDNYNVLVILNGNSYNMKKIYTDNIKEYADNYDIEKDKLNNPSIAYATHYTEKRKLEYYIAVFNSLNSNSYEKAYQLLSQKTKDKYSSVNDFYNDNKYLTTTIKSFNKTTKKNQTIYEITTTKYDKITIIEDRIMKYTIEY